VADCDHGRAPSAPWGGPPAQMQWIAPHALQINYHPASRLFLSASEVAVSMGWFSKASIKVTFVPIATQPPNRPLTPPGAKNGPAS
jgi:hypothetical protein